MTLNHCLPFGENLADVDDQLRRLDENLRNRVEVQAPYLMTGQPYKLRESSITGEAGSITGQFSDGGVVGMLVFAGMGSEIGRASCRERV